MSPAMAAVKAGAHCDTAALMLQHAARCQGEGFTADASPAQAEAAKYLRKAQDRIADVLGELEKGGVK